LKEPVAGPEGGEMGVGTMVDTATSNPREASPISNGSQTVMPRVIGLEFIRLGRKHPYGRVINPNRLKVEFP
jgi:hypothetical protein